ncbi:MAG: hypothetical protein D6784_16270 [Chloroflexi bacterium]|nr:MAG: hypothetical protein D6784_16270 [Chloroflexota bacterium]
MHRYQARKKIRKQTRRKQTRRVNKSVFTTLAVPAVIAVVVTLAFGLQSLGSAPGAAPTPVITIAPPEPQAGAVLAPTVSLAEMAYRPGKDFSGFRVGLVSGHKGYDPGAVCPDGLTEAEVNAVIAEETAHLLRRRGVETDLLEEYDARLADYQADALVSIHADSCNIPGATGFKVARVTTSAIPDAEDRLVNCLYAQYELYTGLPRHPASITDDMTNYHAFNEINPYTPGAIIETGFLLDDRFMLESRPKIIARGIAAGILCFLDQ